MADIKIMIFTDWYEPGFKAGGPIRSCVNFATRMKEDYEIYIFTGDRDLGDAQPYPGIERNNWIERNGSLLFYASPASLNLKNILAQIRRVKPDYVYLNNMYSRCFTIYPLLFKRLGLTGAQIVLAPRGMLQRGAMQFKTAKKKLFLNLLNVLGIPKLIQAQATDEQEKKDILKYLPQIKKVVVIPNYTAPVPLTPTPIKKTGRELRMVYISRIAAKKNMLFLLSLLSQLQEEDPQIICTIRGGIEDEAYWQDCRNIIQQLPNNITVQYEGPVNHNEVISVIQQHHLFVLPTLGENFGHAVFEALSAGRPVLISDQTPWRNLSEHYAGWDLPLSDPSAFVGVIQQVTDMDDEEFQRWSMGAWQYAKEFAENAGLKERYRQLFP